MNDLIRQLATKDAALARDIEKEVKALADRRAFGLNFERHTPEAVDLPGRRPVLHSKVRVLPPRGQMPKKENDRLWAVSGLDRTIDPPVASLTSLDGSDEEKRASVDDVVVVAEFDDPIYPGLVSTGKVERGGDKPHHAVINAENYHALQSLLFTHRGKVDCIYIDPPYNTGAKDWKYNNDYVESDDLYRHSKWLAFMERRLLLAKELLNPEDSVLIVTIDEKEYMRLGLLLEQLFPEARIQMATVVINSQGTPRVDAFSRVEEYLFAVQLGSSRVSHSFDDLLAPVDRGPQTAHSPQLWYPLLRSGTDPFREDAPNQFYPIYLDPVSLRVHSVGEPLPLTASRDSVRPPSPNLEVVWPILGSGRESRWQLSRESLLAYVDSGYARAGSIGRTGLRSFTYLRRGTISRIENGEIAVKGRDARGALILDAGDLAAKRRAPKSVWNRGAHEAGEYGSKLLRRMMPDRKFPFPKSLYAVEDSVGMFVRDKPEAVIVDFFSGSGTTAHAVMRLNRRDGGRRQAIAVTNNEVSSDEQQRLRLRGLRPGDPDWEEYGICDYITKPRIAAAVTGRTPNGSPVEGDYKFSDEFPMADGFEENVEFFTLTYESRLRVEANYAFGRIAPLLWLRAGSQGRRIDELPDGWDVAETYGVISDLDHSEEFAQAIASAPAASVAFIITDEDRLFEALVRELPDHVEPVRLYEAYLRTFEIEARRAAER